MSFFHLFFFFFKQKTAYEIASCLVGSEMCIRDRPFPLDDDLPLALPVLELLPDPVLDAADVAVAVGALTGAGATATELSLIHI